MSGLMMVDGKRVLQTTVRCEVEVWVDDEVKFLPTNHADHWPRALRAFHNENFGKIGRVVQVRPDGQLVVSFETNNGEIQIQLDPRHLVAVKPRAWSE